MQIIFFWFVNNKPKKYNLHTLYISPLKALTIDVHRNLTSPIEDQGLDIRVETRTGDTSAYKKNRQKVLPPDMLMTTPESLALLLSNKESKDYFKNIEAEMKKIIKSKRKFTGTVVSRDEAAQKFSDQKYKLEIIEGIPKNEKVTRRAHFSITLKVIESRR